MIPSIYNYAASFKEGFIKNTAYFISNGTQSDIDASNWFVKEIFDLVKKEIPEFSISFIGSFDEEFKEVNAKDGITFETFRDIEYDIDFCLKHREMCILPIRFYSGIDERLVRAILNETPVVTTSVMAKSLNLDRGDALMCDTPEAFVQSIKNIDRSITTGAKGKFSEIANLAKIHEDIYKHLN